MTAGERIRGLPALCGRHPRILILGSMPSVSSLEQKQYYGHPRNAFWPIMADLLGFEKRLPYEESCRRVTRHGIAIWDVIGECIRPGSLDSAIVQGSERINPVDEFIDGHPEIATIALNGGTAARLFKRHCLPHLEADELRILEMPSTSPANARMNYAEKRERWRRILA